MKSIELLAIGVRLLGVYLLVSGMRLALKLYQLAQQGPIHEGGQYDYVYLGVAEVALVFLVALLMLKFPMTLSRWIHPASAGAEIGFSGQAGELETTLLVVLGVYILTWAIPDFFDNAIWWLYLSRSIEASNADKDMVVINQLVTLLEIAIGLFLCLRAKGLSAMLRRLRTAGIE